MRTILILIILFGPLAGKSQDFVDLVNAYWRISPANSIEGNSYKRDFHLWGINAKLPLVLNDNNLLVIGPEFQQHRLPGIDGPLEPYTAYNFSSIGLQLGFEHKWNDDFKTMFMGIPRLNTGFDRVDGTHLQMAGLIMNTKKRSEKFAWQYGLYYNSEFFGPMFVPFFGLKWKISEKWFFRMALPINMELAYQPKKWFRCGFRFDGVNASYRIVDPPNFTSQTIRYVDRADNNVWLFSEFKLFNNVWFHLRAGHSAIRKYRIYDNDEKLAVKIGPVNVGGNRPTTTNSLFQDGWTFGARFIYRLPLDKKN